MTRSLRSVCVYCGSSFGADPTFADVAAGMGRIIAEAGLDLVYGGGSVGLMGVVADSALAAGGRVIGVIPRGLFKEEVAHPGLSELIEVTSMHARKMAMFERADAFVALPGGLGTLEELTETATWAQIGLHDRPIVTVDHDGFWQPLHRLVDGFIERGFLKRSPLINVDSAEEVLPAIRGR